MNTHTQKELLNDGFLKGLRTIASTLRAGMNALDPESAKMFAPWDALKGGIKNVRSILDAFDDGPEKIARQYLRDTYERQGIMFNIKYIKSFKGNKNSIVGEIAAKFAKASEQLYNRVATGYERSPKEMASGSTTPSLSAAEAQSDNETEEVKKNEFIFPFRYILFEADVKRGEVLRFKRPPRVLNLQHPPGPPTPKPVVRENTDPATSPQANTPTQTERRDAPYERRRFCVKLTRTYTDQGDKFYKTKGFQTLKGAGSPDNRDEWIPIGLTDEEGREFSETSKKDTPQSVNTSTQETAPVKPSPQSVNTSTQETAPVKPSPSVILKGSRYGNPYRDIQYGPGIWGPANEQTQKDVIYQIKALSILPNK